MRSYLIVANQTLTSQSLTDAIRDRLADGPVRTHVVVPLSPVGGRLTWDEVESRGVAQERLEEVIGDCARWAPRPTARSAIATR